MPRKNRRRIDDQDEQFDQAEGQSKWASILTNKKAKEQEDEEEELQPKKEIFNFDFSKQHLLYKQREEVKKQIPKVILTPEEQAELQRRNEKQRIEREEKEKIKKQKKMQKKKQLDKQKQEERIKKEQQQRIQVELQQKLKQNKSNSDGKKIMTVLVIILLFLGLLQYQKDIYARLAKFRLNTSVDYYQVLQTSSSVSDPELKNQYKKLVMKYHPDKNPNCHSCKEKFNSIMQAWQVLGNPEKRQHYDQNSGFINQIKSQTLTLTPDNYEWLLADSDDFWIVQVYDSTSEYCHFFASFWQEFAQKYEGILKVGRIDVWKQSQMRSYIPFKFQLFPGIYSMHRGEQMLCQLDFERPLRSLQLCAESRIQQIPITKISDWSEIQPQAGKQDVILGGGVKVSTTIKLIHARFSRYLNFYIMKDKSISVIVKNKDFKFDLDTTGSKTIFKKYKRFLEGILIQQKSSCEILYQCKQRACLLLLDDDYVQTQLHPYPLIKVLQKEQFTHKINEIKNLTGLFQKFELGFYKDGKIELGYFNQIEDLNPENGEVIEFHCRQKSLLFKLQQLYGKIMKMFGK